MSIETDIFEDFLTFCQEAKVQVRPNNSLKEKGVLFDEEEMFYRRAEDDVKNFLLEEEINSK